MNEEIKIYLSKYPTEIIILFEKLRQTIIESVSVPVEEKCGLSYQLIMLKNHLLD